MPLSTLIKTEVKPTERERERGSTFRAVSSGGSRMQHEKRREEREAVGGDRQGVKRGRRLLRHSRRDKRKLLNQEKQERNRSRRTGRGPRGVRGGEAKKKRKRDKKRNAKQPSL